MAVGQAILTALGFALVAGVGQPMLADLREQVVDRALRLPAARVERAGRGDLLARVGDDVAVVSEAVVEALPALAGAALTVVLTFVGLAAIDVRIALAGLLCVPVQIAALRWYLRRANAVYGAERVAGGERAQALLDVVGGARTVRALDLAGVELPRVADRSTAAVAAAVRTIRVSTGFFSRLNFAELVGTAAVLAAGFLLVRADALSVGGATAGALLFVRLFDQFNVVLGTVDDAQRALAALARLVGVAALPPPADPPAPPAPALDGSAAAVRVDGVGHAYVPGHPRAPRRGPRARAGRAARARRRVGRRQDDARQGRGGVPRADGRRGGGRRRPARRARARGDAPHRRPRHPGGARVRRHARRRPAPGGARGHGRRARGRARSWSGRSSGRGRSPTAWPRGSAAAAWR